MNISRLFSKMLTAPFKSYALFENVVGHDHIKRLFGIASDNKIMSCFGLIDLLLNALYYILFSCSF
jgi:hypothetical protein